MLAKLIAYVLVRDAAQGQVLLVSYTKDASPKPERSGIWIPAPQLEPGEHPEDCARRVLSSLGIGPDAGGVRISLAGFDSFTTRDWHVMFNYVVDVPTGTAIKPDPRYAEAGWFAIGDLPEAKRFAHGNWERELVGKLSVAVS